MNSRKKKGIGYAISGGVFIGVGAVLYFLPETPSVVSLAIQVVGMIAGFFGFTTVFPDVD